MVGQEVEMRIITLLALAVGCSKEEETEETGAPTETGPSESESETDSETESESETETEPLTCGKTAPTVQAVVVTAAGLVKNPEGTLLPAMLFAIEGHDDDGDLDLFGYQMWFDETVDGAVDTAATAPLLGSTTLAGDPCTLTDVNLNLTVTTDGGSLPYGTEMEFALVISDARGTESAAFVFTGWVPDENGEDVSGKGKK